MRLVEQGGRSEEHFTEGEPDLEAPEELALGELDEDALLEEDLDNEDVAEEDVDEVVLALTLEDLVHSDDNEEYATPEDAKSRAFDEIGLPHRPETTSVGSVPGLADVEDLQDERDDLEVADLEDLDESLDRILADRLAGDAQSLNEQDEDELPTTSPPFPPPQTKKTTPKTSSCREGEFVCRSCFLVRSRAQLADPAGGICRDCSA
jgi:hypothetical protein